MIKNPDSPENPHIRPNQTFICSVVFIDLVEYSKKPFVEQILIKERFNIHLAEAIKDISLNYRIVLDTGDGAAIGFIGDPEDALFVAMSLRDALMDDDSEVAPNLKVRMGINLGPVKILKDINNQMNMIGDGINAAERIMSFSEPGQLLVSRSYYDIVSCLSQEYAQLFHYQGSRADKHVREHDLYAVEHTRMKLGSLYNRPDRKQNGCYGEEDDPVEPVRLAAEESYRAYPRKADRDTSAGWGRKGIMIGGALAAVLAGLIFLLPGEKAPSEQPKSVATPANAVPESKPVPAVTTAIPEKPLPNPKIPATSRKTQPEQTVVTAKTQAEPVKKTVKKLSARAGDVLFTFIDQKSQGNEITMSIQTYNGSSETKRIAIYDDAYWWAKSQILDETGEKHDVSEVVFLNDAEKISMSLTGTQGIAVAPKKSVIANLTFKKSFKTAKTLVLHPFICHEGNCSEHNLVMNLNK
jgi:hypothetical protein